MIKLVKENYKNFYAGMEKTGVVFDMDGVIIDTCQLHEISWFNISRIYGFSWNKTLNFKKDVFGTSSIDSMTLLFGTSIQMCDVPEICRKKDEIYKELLYKNLQNIVSPYFMKFFKNLVQLNIPIALATSSICSEAEYVLKKLGIYNDFKAVIDISKVKNPKPHPEIYLKACEALELQPYRCIGFEDSMTGIKALQDAGLTCVVIGSTLSRERLNRSGLKYELYIKDFNINTIDQILSLKQKEYFLEANEL